MKKLICLLLSCVIVFGLAACSGSEEAQSTSTGSAEDSAAENQNIQSEKPESGSEEEKIPEEVKDPFYNFRTYSFDWSWEGSCFNWSTTNEYLYDAASGTQMSLTNGYRSTLSRTDDAGRTTVYINYGDAGEISQVEYSTYNSEGKIIDKTYTNGDYIHYTEDGRKTESLLSGILREYSYDTAGNLVTITKKITADSEIIVFEYKNNEEGNVTETDLIINGEPRGCFMTCEYHADGTYSEYYYRSVMPWYNMGTFDVKDRVTENAELYDEPCVRVDYRSDGNVSCVALLDDGSTAEYVYCEYGDPAKPLLTEVNVSGRDNVKIIKEYNEDGKILRSASQMPGANGEMYETIDYINEYDEEGHLLLKTEPSLVDPTVGDRTYYEWSDGQGNVICSLDDVTRFSMEGRGLTEEDVKTKILDAFHEKYPETAGFGVNDVIWSQVVYGYVDLAGGCDAYHAAFVIPGVENLQCCSGSAIVDTVSNIVCFDDDPMYEIYNEYLYRAYVD